LKQLVFYLLFFTFIEKLNFIKEENSKILKKLEDISKGKELSVGLHHVNPIL
jgi:hypothetical protein